MLQTASIKLVSYNKQVYSPSEDSFALVDAVIAASNDLKQIQPKTCIEIGCGSGYVICSLALILKQFGNNAQLYATDISAPAIAATAQTLTAHQVSSVEIVQTDLLGGLQQRLQSTVDLLLFNPPYVPSPDNELRRDDIARAWAGGRDGRVVIDRVLDKLDSWLSPKGRMYMVTISQNDPQGIIKLMNERGFTGTVVHKTQADEESLQIVCLSRTSNPSAKQ